MRESDAIAALIAEQAHVITEGDVAWVDRHVPRRDELEIIGTAPDEWLRGTAAFDALRQEADKASGALKANVRDVTAFESGNVGWGSARVAFTTSDGAVANARVTMVFERSGAAWELLQLHMSVAVDDEAAFS